jgi:hypothetical protein
MDLMNLHLGFATPTNLLGHLFGDRRSRRDIVPLWRSTYIASHANGEFMC